MDNRINKDMPQFMGKIIAGFLLIFFATYFITYVQIDGGGDFGAHKKWATEFNFTYFVEYFTNRIPYPMWHFLTKAAKVFLNTSYENAGAIVTATANGFSFLLTVFAQRYLYRMMNIKLEVIPFWAICLMFVGPLYIPRFNEIYDPGAGTGNIWHNPTSIMVKPFAIFIFCVIAKIVEDNRKIKFKEIIVLVVSLFFSGLAKPSFLQGIIPGLGLFMIVHLIKDFSKERFIKYAILASTFIPSVLLMVLQLYNTLFEHGEVVNVDTSTIVGPVTIETPGYKQGIGFAWGKGLSHWTPNIYVSFLLAVAFPMFVFLYNHRRMIKDKIFQLALCYEFVAWIEGVILYQKGPAEHQGNFLWASYHSLYVFFMICTFYFLDSSTKIDLSKKGDTLYLLIGNVLLFLHLMFGIFFAISYIHVFWVYGI